MKYIPAWVVTVFLICGCSALSAQVQGPTVRKIGKFEAPPDSRNLEGRIIVLVSVGADGKVTSVDSLSGPGYVCPQVLRPDVVAVREAARSAALNSTFSPGDNPARATLEFNLPVRHKSDAEKDQVFEVGAHPEQRYTIASPGNSTNGQAPRTISGGVLEGSATSLPKPAYPPAARAVRASGEVQIRVLIDEEGSIFSAEPVAGHPLLRSASAIAACKAKFPPTLLSGKPVKVSGIVTYNFVP